MMLSGIGYDFKLTLPSTKSANVSRYADLEKREKAFRDKAEKVRTQDGKDYIPPGTYAETETGKPISKVRLDCAVSNSDSIMLDTSLPDQSSVLASTADPAVNTRATSLLRQDSHEVVDESMWVDNISDVESDSADTFSEGSEQSARREMILDQLNSPEF